MAESNLEQLWAEETERRMDDLAEVNDDSEEYIEDEDNPDKETKQLGAIGSSKPRSGRDSNTPHGDDNEDNVTTPRPETLNKSNIEERLDKFEVRVGFGIEFNLTLVRLLYTKKCLEFVHL